MTIQIVEELETFELEDGDSVLVLRRVPADVHQEIERRHTKRYRTRQGEWARERDDHSMLMELLDYAIFDWRNVQSPITGQDVPCTAENKRRLPLCVMERVFDALSEQGEVKAGVAREALGNLNGSSA